ncbi:class I SAM-dependent methyltransferase [Corallococcus macrosporus]|uniref:class I SAM-dependent methyltransferase n=1 Tax=Corallococcus macrosporus TaxID=35 RepID=UPI001F5E3299|nr:class I SAM-dependent methyltransferase [Corallococcus macrosporus]
MSFQSALACGDGLYTRQLKARGAQRVAGVDISEEMVRVAREYEAAQPLGIEYHVADVADMAPLGVFDCVTAIYLLHYAHSPEHLLRMCRSIHAHLKPGGRFVTYSFNPGFSAKGPNSTRYGITMLDFPESPGKDSPSPRSCTRRRPSPSTSPTGARPPTRTPCAKQASGTSPGRARSVPRKALRSMARRSGRTPWTTHTRSR